MTEGKKKRSQRNSQGPKPRTEEKYAGCRSAFLADYMSQPSYFRGREQSVFGCSRDETCLRDKIVLEVHSFCTTFFILLSEYYYMVKNSHDRNCVAAKGCITQ